MADLSSTAGPPVPPPRPSGSRPPLPPRQSNGRRQSDTPKVTGLRQATMVKSNTFNDDRAYPDHFQESPSPINSLSAPLPPHRFTDHSRKTSVPMQTNLNSSTSRKDSVLTSSTIGDNTYVVASEIVRPQAYGGGSQMMVAGKQPSLQDQDWYWPDITKEDVTEIMKDMHDGAFLVRTAARVPGYYTLTLRKSGVNRLIRIMHREGLYGFAEPLEFPSVVALVDYYRTHSLAPYSPKLDITLGSPVSRSAWMQRQMVDEMEDIGRIAEVTADKMLENLREIEQDLKDMSKKYNTLKQQFERTNEEIRNMRIEISAQNEIIVIMDEGLKEHERHHSQCNQSQKASLLANFDLLRRRYRIQRDSHDDLNQKLRRSEMTKNYLDMELNNLKPNLKRLQVDKGNILRFLQQRGWRNDEINARIERIEASSRGEEIEEDEGLYATYAMLHTIRNESDYQRLSQELKDRGHKRPPPLLKNDTRRGSSVSSPHSVSTPRHPNVDMFRDRLDTVVNLPPFSHGHDYPDFNQQLISYKDLKVPHNLPHFEQSAWMNPSISREGSRDMLTGKPNGTFLVRPKIEAEEVAGTPSHTHTIDIVDGGKFKRIAVFRGPHGGYGFADPYEFDSLLSLVVYYSTNTMEKHNPGLQAMLTYPAFYVTK